MALRCQMKNNIIEESNVLLRQLSSLIKDDLNVQTKIKICRHISSFHYIGRGGGGGGGVERRGIR